MPILPFDYPEPFAATLGVMLYPEMDEDERGKARAFSDHGWQSRSDGFTMLVAASNVRIGAYF